MQYNSVLPKYSYSNPFKISYLYIQTPLSTQKVSAKSLPTKAKKINATENKVNKQNDISNKNPNRYYPKPLLRQDHLNIRSQRYTFATAAYHQQ